MRETQTVHLTMPYAQAAALLPSGAPWSNVFRETKDKLYKCVQAHTSQALWEPAATPALWVVIDVAHAGTQDDPISAARGMEYTYGLYYKDPEDTKLYLCERTGEAAGGKIVLQYLPHELVGNYFTAV